MSITFEFTHTLVANSGTNHPPYSDAVLRVPTERRALNERREQPATERGGVTPFSGNPRFKKLPTSPCERVWLVSAFTAT